MKSELCKYSEQLMPKHSSLSLLQKPLEGVKLNLAISGKQETCVWLTTQILCQQITRAFFSMPELSLWMLPNVYWKNNLSERRFRQREVAKSQNQWRILPNTAGLQTIVLGLFMYLMSLLNNNPQNKRGEVFSESFNDSFTF